MDANCQPRAPNRFSSFSTMQIFFSDPDVVASFTTLFRKGAKATGDEFAFYNMGHHELIQRGTKEWILLSKQRKRKKKQGKQANQPGKNAKENIHKVSPWSDQQREIPKMKRSVIGNLVCINSVFSILCNNLDYVVVRWILSARLAVLHLQLPLPG